MANQISRIRNRVTLLVSLTAATALVFLFFVIPVVSDLTPQAARRTWLNFAILSPLGIASVLLLLRTYLRPISDLGYALEIGSTPTVELSRNARRIAFNAPVRFFVFAVGGVFLLSLLANIVGSLLWTDYLFAEHVLATLLSTAVAGCGALVVALACRQLMRPVLLYTASQLQSGGFRLNIHTRLLAASVALVMLAVLFPGAFGVTRVISAYREQLADTTLLRLEDALEHLPAGSTHDQTLDDVVKYIDPSVEYDHLFLINAGGEVLARRSLPDLSLTFDSALWLKGRPSKLRQASAYFCLSPVSTADREHWVGVGFMIHPLRSTEVVRTVMALSATTVLALTLALVISRYMATDIVTDVRDVTARLLEIAHKEHVDLSSAVPMLSHDEVGDLILAYNALQQRVRLQQEQIEYKQRQLIALQSLSYKIGTVRNVEHLLREVIRDVERAFGYHNVSILLVDDQQGDLYFAATGLIDTSLIGRRFRIGQDGVVGHVAATGTPLLINDVSTCEFYIPDRTNTRSELAVPLTFGDQVIGVFNVSSERIGAFEESDLRVITALSNQVAIAIENARLFHEVVTNANELELRARNLTILHNVSTALSASLRLDDVLKTVTEQLVSLFELGYCAVILFDEQKEYGQITAEYPAKGIAGQQVHLKDLRVTQRILTAPQPLYIADAQRSEQLRALRDSLKTLDARSALIVPLTAKGNVEGFILLTSIGEPRHFTPAEIDTCQTISAHVAVSVENVRLIESLSMQADALARMARDVAAEKSQLNAILHNLVDGLLVTDPDGRIVLFNPALLHLFGLSKEGLEEQFLTEVMPDAPLQNLVQQIGQTGIAQVQDMTLPDGRSLQVTAAGVHKGKDLHAVVMVLRDVTRERQLEEMKSAFISTVSHELRTPLTPVLGFAKLIQKTFNRSILPALPDEKAPHRAAERIDQNLDILIGEVNQLSKLVDDVLFLADLDAGRLKWHTEVVDIVQILQEMTQEFRSQAKDKGLDLHIDCPADLAQVHGDRERLERVIRNLISNAVKFTDKGEIHIQAQTIQRQDGQWTTEPCVDVPQQLSSASYVLVAVRDTGSGILPETRQKLFERFGQGMHDILTDKPSGTGLGLALSKEIIGYHGGRIWADSVPGQGSTFAFVLPLSAESSERSLWGEAISLPNTAPTILVVDDEPGVRELLSYILLRAGYRTLVAVDGPAALNMARGHKPDLIVLDIMIPGISGLDVTSVLKADESTRQIPIIILSVLANEERAAQLGADACFSKPFDRDALLERIGELLALHSAARAEG